MLKFAVDRHGEGKPALLGLGLSFENLRQLPAAAIQFFAGELDLGNGIFVIAHAGDRELPGYAARVGADVCELVVLSEAECAELRRGALVTRPLRALRRGSACEAVLFAGPTEEALLASMRQAGMVAPETRIAFPQAAAPAASSRAPAGPPPPPARPPQAKATPTEFRVSTPRLAWVSLTWLVVAVLALALLTARHASGVMLAGGAVAALGALAGLVYLVSLRDERVVIGTTGVEVRRAWRPFTLRWPEIAVVGVQRDALGPYRLDLRTHVRGVRRLGRGYRDWHQLVEAVVTGVNGGVAAHGRSTWPAPPTLLAGPRVLSHGHEATFVSELVATLPGGTRIVDLRRAAVDEVGAPAIIDRVARELEAAGPPGQLVAWLVPGSALSSWSAALVEFIDRIARLSILRTQGGDLVAQAFVVAGPAVPAPGLSELLRQCGMQLFAVGADDPAPVVEIGLGTGRVTAGVTVAEVADVGRAA
ncbi:MAG: hypothetical protein U1F43_27030 [Myxococcota bacterium]